MKEIALKIADVLGLPVKERELFAVKLSKYLDDLIKMGRYIKRTSMINLNEFWYNCLLSIYELTDEVNKHGFLVPADVPPQSSYTYEIDLTPTTECCLCPVRWNSASLGDYVLLTNLVNENPVDVKRQWQNKYAAINEPMGTDASITYPRRYVYFPKRKVKVMFHNTHQTETSRCTFYADYLAMDFDKGKRLIEHCYEEFVKEVMIMMGLMEEDEVVD